MAKHKYIESPERMWQLFELYKKELEDEPIEVQDYVGKDGEEVYRKKQRPLTMEGFECFVMDNTEITYPDLTEYFEGKNESYKDYFPICSRIRRNIRRNQIEGGMVGIYNPSITQRLNGLVEKSSADDRKEVIFKVIDGDDNKVDNDPDTASGTSENII